MPQWLQELIQRYMQTQGVSGPQSPQTVPPAYAQARFTRNPVVIQSKYGDVEGPGEEPVNGNYVGDQGGRVINVYKDPGAKYADLQHVIQHEQIHALLDRLSGGYDYPGGNLGLNDRVGSYGAEMPAYTGAFRLGELLNQKTNQPASLKEAQGWQHEFQSRLPPTVQQLLQRIIQSRTEAPAAPSQGADTFARTF